MADYPYSNEATQAERKAIVKNDSYFARQSHTVDDAGGRYAKLTPATITGATPSPQYPSLPASSPWSSGFDTNVEPELGFAVDGMPANEIQTPTLKPPEVHALPATVEDRVGEPVGTPPLVPTGSHSMKRRSW
jgi:hypothetical protein